MPKTKFDELKNKIEKNNGYTDAEAAATAAAIGRRKYGEQQFEKLAEDGRNRNADQKKCYE